MCALVATLLVAFRDTLPPPRRTSGLAFARRPAPSDEQACWHGAAGVLWRRASLSFLQTLCMLCVNPSLPRLYVHLPPWLPPARLHNCSSGSWHTNSCCRLPPLYMYYGTLVHRRPPFLLHASAERRWRLLFHYVMTRLSTASFSSAVLPALFRSLHCLLQSKALCCSGLGL